MEDLYGTHAITLPLAWLTALAGSELRVAVYGMRVLHGAVRFLHLLAMAGFFGAVVLLELRRMGLLPEPAFTPARLQIGRVIVICFWTTVASGVALFLYDPLGIGLHSMFLPKLGLVTLGYALARLRPRAPMSRRAMAAASLGIWVAVLGASTWNHVERPARLHDALKAGTYGRK